MVDRRRRARIAVGSIAVCGGMALAAIGIGAGTASAFPGPPPPRPGQGLCVPLLPCGGPQAPPAPMLGPGPGHHPGGGPFLGRGF